MHTPFGFIAFGVGSRRHLVDRARTVAGYCACDTAAILDVPSFVSAFAFPAEFMEHLRATGSTADYFGPVGVPALAWDLDRNDLADALRDGARLAAHLINKCALDAASLMVGFSGSKGIHVELPLASGVVEASPHANLVARLFAETTAQEVGVEIDSGVYDKVRCWRLWNTRHARTGLYKVRLDADDLPMLSTDAVRRLAVHPRDFTVPAPVYSSALVKALEHAERAVGRRFERQAEENTFGAENSRPIMRQTLDLIRSGCALGERHRRLFSAAADLARFDRVEDLVVALLFEPGRDLGLAPRDVSRQIACGIQQARGKPQGGAA